MSSLNLMPSVLSQKRPCIIPLPFNTCITHYSIHSLPLYTSLQCQLPEPCISTKSLHTEFKEYGNYSSRVSIGKEQCVANYFRAEAKGIPSSERFEISFMRVIKRTLFLFRNSKNKPSSFQYPLSYTINVLFTASGPRIFNKITCRCSC